jgi:hypothetical protein
VPSQEFRTTVEGLPVGWVEDMRQASVALDIEQMLALIETIRPQAPQLAATLEGWVLDFEIDKLLTLTTPKGYSGEE